MSAGPDHVLHEITWTGVLTADQELTDHFCGGAESLGRECGPFCTLTR